MKNGNFSLMAQVRNQVESTKTMKANATMNKELEDTRNAWKAKGFNTGGQVLTRGITGMIMNVQNDAAKWKTYGPQHQQRAWQLIDELGVKFLTDLRHNVKYPSIDNQNSVWRVDGQTVEPTTTLNDVALTPRELLSIVDYSNEVVLSTDAELEKEIESDLIESIFEKVQETMFNDIYVSEGATTLSDFDGIVSFELAASNKKISNGVYLVSPTAASKLKKMKNGQMPVMVNGMINGYRVIETPSLNGEKVIFGDFSKLLLGQFGLGLDVTVDNVTKQAEGIIRLIINSYWDWDKLDENAFVYATTATE